MDILLRQRFKIGKFFKELIPIDKNAGKDETLIFIEVPNKTHLLISLNDFDLLKKQKGNVEFINLADGSKYKTTTDALVSVSKRISEIKIPDELKPLLTIDVQSLIPKVEKPKPQTAASKSDLEAIRLRGCETLTSVKGIDKDKYFLVALYEDQLTRQRIYLAFRTKEKYDEYMESGAYKRFYHISTV